MSESETRHHTAIEWTRFPGREGRTWNPLVAFARISRRRGTMCQKINRDCAHCYAAAINQEYGTGHNYDSAGLKHVESAMVNLYYPLSWQAPAAIFPGSMTDVFLDEWPDEWLLLLFGVIELTPRHLYIVLTKHGAESGRMRDFFRRYTPGDFARALRECRDDEVTKRLARESEKRAAYYGTNKRAEVLPNLWLGVSAGHREAAERFAPVLAETPAQKRILSYEPAIDPPWFLDLFLGGSGSGSGSGSGRPFIDWVIVSGESEKPSALARAMAPEWARAVYRWTRRHRLPMYFKQYGMFKPVALHSARPSDIFIHVGSGARTSGAAARLSAQRAPAAYGGDAMRRVLLKRHAGNLLDVRDGLGPRAVEEFPAAPPLPKTRLGGEQLSIL